MLLMECISTNGRWNFPANTKGYLWNILLFTIIPFNNFQNFFAGNGWCWCCWLFIKYFLIYAEHILYHLVFLFFLFAINYFQRSQWILCTDKLLYQTELRNQLSVFLISILIFLVSTRWTRLHRSTLVLQYSSCLMQQHEIFRFWRHSLNK